MIINQIKKKIARAALNGALDQIKKYRAAVEKDEDNLTINLFNSGVIVNLKTLKKLGIDAAEKKLSELKGKKNL